MVELLCFLVLPLAAWLAMLAAIIIGGDCE